MHVWTKPWLLLTDPNIVLLLRKTHTHTYIMKIRRIYARLLHENGYTDLHKISTHIPRDHEKISENLNSRKQCPEFESRTGQFVYLGYFAR